MPRSPPATRRRCGGWSSRGPSSPRRGPTPGSRRCCRRSTTGSRGSSTSCSPRTRRSTSSTRPPSGARAALEELLDPEPELARAWSPDGFTALHYAAFFGQEDAAKLLLERGADAEVVARHESIHVTPLHSAAAGAHAGIVKLLLEHGADPNAAQDEGSTPLHSAADNDDRETVEALLAAGADASLANDAGQTPVQIAGDGVRELLG